MNPSPTSIVLSSSFDHPEGPSSSWSRAAKEEEDMPFDCVKIKSHSLHFKDNDHPVDEMNVGLRSSSNSNNNNDNNYKYNNNNYNNNNMSMEEIGDVPLASTPLIKNDKQNMLTTSNLSISSRSTSFRQRRLQIAKQRKLKEEQQKQYNDDESIGGESIGDESIGGSTLETVSSLNTNGSDAFSSRSWLPPKFKSTKSLSGKSTNSRRKAMTLNHSPQDAMDRTSSVHPPLYISSTKKIRKKKRNGRRRTQPTSNDIEPPSLPTSFAKSVDAPPLELGPPCTPVENDDMEPPSLSTSFANNTNTNMDETPSPLELGLPCTPVNDDDEMSQSTLGTATSLFTCKPRKKEDMEKLLKDKQRKLRLLHFALTCNHPITSKGTSTGDSSSPEVRHYQALTTLVKHVQTCTFSNSNGSNSKTCDVPGCGVYKKLWNHSRRCILKTFHEGEEGNGDRKKCKLCGDLWTKGCIDAKVQS